MEKVINGVKKQVLCGKNYDYNDEIALAWWDDDEDEDEDEDEFDLIQKGDHYDDYGRYTGRTDDKGNHYDDYGRYIGRTDEKGNHYDNYGRYTGKTDDNGNHYDDYGRYIGRTDNKGNNYDSYGAYKGSTKGGSSGGCYLTTACVKFKGLEDDCIELTKLRSFRDNYMKKNYEMKSEVTRYYEVAPAIVKGISVLDIEEQMYVYDSIYNIIKKCICLIDANRNKEAYAEYKHMVNYLIKQYL